MSESKHLSLDTVLSTAMCVLFSVFMFFWSQFYTELWKKLIKDNFNNSALPVALACFAFTGFAYILLTKFAELDILKFLKNKLHEKDD
jgi:hypothetical protein